LRVVGVVVQMETLLVLAVVVLEVTAQVQALLVVVLLRKTN
jgi:hypothetical protein